MSWQFSGHRSSNTEEWFIKSRDPTSYSFPYLKSWMFRLVGSERVYNASHRTDDDWKSHFLSLSLVLSCDEGVWIHCVSHFAQVWMFVVEDTHASLMEFPNFCNPVDSEGHMNNTISAQGLKLFSPFERTARRRPVLGFEGVLSKAFAT